MLSLIRRYCHADDGATATEYAILVIFAVTVIAVGLNILGTGINTLFSTLGRTIQSASARLP